MSDFAKAGSQRWLQIAVNRKPQLLLSALRRGGAIGPRVSVTWHTPLEGDEFREYRDQPALAKAGIANLKRLLESFWPARGPVWDGIGVSSEGSPLFMEAKAHIPEAASPATRASAASRELIERSLKEARRFYAPRATAVWSDLFRLAIPALAKADWSRYSRNSSPSSGSVTSRKPSVRSLRLGEER